MLIVYVQDHGSNQVDPILIAAQRHKLPLMHGFPAFPGMWLKQTHDVAIVYPEGYCHPEVQAEFAQKLALTSHKRIVVIGTHSLTILYALNNAILKHKLKVQAWGLQVGKRKKRLDNKDGFIDESFLGRVSSDLHDELNKFTSCCKSATAHERWFADHLGVK